MFKLCFTLAAIKIYLTMEQQKQHFITLEAAVAMTTRFRNNQPDEAPLCETFSRKAIKRLIKVDGCERIRIYYGMKENNEMHAILVAADKDDNDLLPDSTNVLMDDDGDDPVIIEDSFRCPPHCPPESPLNP